MENGVLSSIVFNLDSRYEISLTVLEVRFGEKNKCALQNPKLVKDYSLLNTLVWSWLWGAEQDANS